MSLNTVLMGNWSLRMRRIRPKLAVRRTKDSHFTRAGA